MLHSAISMTIEPSAVITRLAHQQNTEHVNLLVSNERFGEAARHADEEVDQKQNLKR